MLRYIRLILGLFWIMENKMEASIMGYIGYMRCSVNPVSEPLGDKNRKQQNLSEQ